MKKLETDGTVVSIRGRQRRIRCSVAFVSGDNKGIHEIAGYFRSFNKTNRICRFCHAKSETIQTCYSESEFELRTIEQYNAEIWHLEVDDFSDKVQTMFGIKEECLFNQLDSFHCINKFPVDLSHDVFENGVAQHLIQNVVQFFVQKKVIDADLINARVRCFPYHKNTDRNVPSVFIFRGNHVKASQTCSECWTLLRLLPIMLLMLIDREQVKGEVKQKFDLVIDFIWIVQMMTEEVLTSSELDTFEDRIKAWLRCFHNEFPSFRMKPKFHSLVHYAGQWRKHGPLMNLSAIRFEVKHKQMKQFIANSKNSKIETKSKSAW